MPLLDKPGHYLTDLFCKDLPITKRHLTILNHFNTLPKELRNQFELVARVSFALERKPQPERKEQPYEPGSPSYAPDTPDYAPDSPGYDPIAPVVPGADDPNVIAIDD